jgi:hypothetical protein
MSKEVTSKNFRQKVSNVIKSGKSIRGNVQELVQYSVVRYLDPESNGDLSDMIYLFQQIAGVRSLNHSLLGQYLEDTVNVKVAKTQDGTPTIRKAQKGEAPSLRDNADLSAPWWEHGRAPSVNPVDILKSIEQLEKKIESATGDQPKKPLVAGQECAATAALNELSGLRARVKRLIEDAARESECPDALEDSMANAA